MTQGMRGAKIDSGRESCFDVNISWLLKISLPSALVHEALSSYPHRANEAWAASSVSCLQRGHTLERLRILVRWALPDIECGGSASIISRQLPNGRPRTFESSIYFGLRISAPDRGTFPGVWPKGVVAPQAMAMGRVRDL